MKRLSIGNSECEFDVVESADVAIIDEATVGQGVGVTFWHDGGRQDLIGPEIISWVESLGSGSIRLTDGAARKLGALLIQFADESQEMYREKMSLKAKQ